MMGHNYFKGDIRSLFVDVKMYNLKAVKQGSVSGFDSEQWTMKDFLSCSFK